MLHLAVPIVVALAWPTAVHGQFRSNVAQLTLNAYKAPGVTIPARSGPPGMQGARTLPDSGMSVNSAYRVELRRAGKDPVVLFREKRGGPVPWGRVRAALDSGDAVVVQLVVTPEL